MIQLKFKRDRRTININARDIIYLNISILYIINGIENNLISILLRNIIQKKKKKKIDFRLI